MYACSFKPRVAVRSGRCWGRALVHRQTPLPFPSPSGEREPLLPCIPALNFPLGFSPHTWTMSLGFRGRVTQPGQGHCWHHCPRLAVVPGEGGTPGMWTRQLQSCPAQAKGECLGGDHTSSESHQLSHSLCHGVPGSPGEGVDLSPRSHQYWVPSELGQLWQQRK